MISLTSIGYISAAPSIESRRNRIDNEGIIVMCAYAPLRRPSANLELIARGGGRAQRLLARLPTYFADLRENPSWLPMFVFARTMPGRRLHWLFARTANDQRADSPVFRGVDRADVVAKLRSVGLWAGFALPEAIHREILSFAERTPCFGNFDRRLELLPGEHAEAEKRFDRSILSGHYFERILQCEAALAVQRDPLPLAIARSYLGDQARVVTTRLWWSFPTKGATDADLRLASQDKFHFDLDDWRMLKFFFYLTPVDAESGPHVYVRGSHARRTLRHQTTLFVGHSAAEVTRAYGAENVATLLGAPGFGFVEDPFGFHMGSLARRSPRLAMELGFGVSPPSRRRFHGEPVVA